jgi:hypothetical protein
MISRPFLLVGCLLLSACSCFASCSLPAGTITWLDALRKVQDSPTVDFELGQAQVDNVSCLDDAIVTFQNLANTDDNQQKSLATGMLGVASARKLITSGDRHGAIQALENVASNYENYYPAYLRAIHDLTLLLRDHPDNPAWQFLGSQLDKITVKDDVNGIVAQDIAEIALHDIQKGRTEEGLSRMETYLAKDHSVQIRLQSSILYLQLLWNAGYTSNVRILCQELDREVGEDELDPSLRLQFLEVCSSAYANSPDPQGQLRHARFSAALAKAQGELQ